MRIFCKDLFVFFFFVVVIAVIVVVVEVRKGAMIFDDLVWEGASCWWRRIFDVALGMKCYGLLSVL